MLDLGSKPAYAIQAGGHALKATLLLLLELAVVLSHEGLDFTCHGEELFPLLLIQRDWESSKSVHRHGAFFTDFDGRWPTLLQCRVFGPQSLEWVFSNILLFCNFSGQGPARVGSFHGLSQDGAY